MQDAAREPENLPRLQTKQELEFPGLKRPGRQPSHAVDPVNRFVAEPAPHSRQLLSVALGAYVPNGQVIQLLELNTKVPGGQVPPSLIQ